LKALEAVRFRFARQADIPAMAEIRAGDWGNEEYWRERIRLYMAHQLHPREALRPRASFVGLDCQRVVGLIAGHLTRRFGCDGELEWVSVRHEYRGRGVAVELFQRLAKWFVRHHAHYICVDVEPTNETARRFYARHGAEDLKPHWMVWRDIRRALQ
jgi:GNAT superfamily N-acetyltransferase